MGVEALMHMLVAEAEEQEVILQELHLESQHKHIPSQLDLVEQVK